jgi:hypothetical protein
MAVPLKPEPSAATGRRYGLRGKKRVLSGDGFFTAGSLAFFGCQLQQRAFFRLLPDQAAFGRAALIVAYGC